jgi:hypothetical protein
MPSFGMWRHLGLLKTDVSEERVASNFRAEEITDTFFARVIFSTLKMEATRSYETSVIKRPTRRHIPEDGILNNYCFGAISENLIG